MATKRYISTSFWDDEWVHNLDPSEKLLYLYFMTNTLTNIAGVYKISIDRVSYDTGFNKKTIENIMGKFGASRKLVYFDGYVIIPTWPRHQSWQTKTKIKSGIDAVINSLPEKILNEMAASGYDYAHDRLPIDYHRDSYKPNYSDSDSDSDSDIDCTEVSCETPPRQSTRQSKPKEPKKPYGRYQHVKLTDQEFKDLVDEFGQPAVDEYIRRQDTYVENGHRAYTKCKAVIIDWIEKDKAAGKYSFSEKKLDTPFIPADNKPRRAPKKCGTPGCHGVEDLQLSAVGITNCATCYAWDFATDSAVDLADPSLFDQLRRTMN